MSILLTFEAVNRDAIPYALSVRREGGIPVCYANADKAFRALACRANMRRDAWRRATRAAQSANMIEKATVRI